ncbi:hypothetical protein Micbo1qcDRAFT_221973 [Microdochium bolleyi]|uniref:Uncharacterized protein n=1 Tax=Microdochium bolleyi TaxID=196109 RepID=A0A136IKT8_9PEZI|nr:hypothetical protein Micbo1qcDRAFT_221973 [Microdochium bolleyi]
MSPAPPHQALDSAYGSRMRIRGWLATFEARIRNVAGLKKNLRQEDWLPIWQHCRQLKDAQYSPEVFLNGSLMPWKKVWKEVRRYAAHKAPRGRTLPPLPAGVVVKAGNSSASTFRQQHFSQSTLTNVTEDEDFQPTGADDRLYESTRGSHAQTESWLPKPSPYDHSSIDTSKDHEVLSSLSLSLSDDDGPHPSPSSGPWRFDQSRFLARAFFRLSNNLVNVDHPKREDWLLHTIMFSRIPPTMVGTLAQAQLSTFDAAMHRLALLTIRLDDAEAFSTMISYALDPALTRTSDMIKMLVARDASKCLERFLRVLGPAPETIQTVCCSIKDTLSGRHMKTFKVLTQWLNLALMEESALCYAQVAFHTVLNHPPDNSRIGKSRVDNSRLRTRLYNTLRHHGLAQDTATKLFPLFEVKRIDDQFVADALTLEIGKALLDIILQPNIFAGQWETSFLSLSLRNKAEQLGDYMDVMFDSRADMHRAMLSMLGRIAAFGDSDSWRAAFVALFLSLDTGLSDWIKTRPPFQYLRESTILVHAIRLFGAFGPRTEIVSCVRWLIDQGASFCASSLAAAVSRATTVDTMQQLQHLGADIPRLGAKALVVAAKIGNKSLAAWLIAQGVDVNGTVKVLKSEATVVRIAACVPYEDLDIPSSLVSLDEDVAKSLVTGAQATLLLMTLGAELPLLPNEESPFEFLAAVISKQEPHESLDCLQAILARVDFTDPKASSLLYASGSSRSWNVFEYLLELGVLPDTRAFEIALEGEAPDRILSGLPQACFKPKEVADTHLGRSLMHGACSLARIAVVKQLRRMGADPWWSQNHVQRTALHAACGGLGAPVSEFKRRAILAKYLIAAGVDVNVVDREGFTALDLAAESGNLELVALLLHHRAACILLAIPLAQEIPRALDLAAGTGRLDTVQLLLIAGVKSSRPGETGFDGAEENATGKGHEVVAKLIKQFAQGLRKPVTMELNIAGW